MTVRPGVLALILGCAFVTAMPRILPLLFLSKVEIPEGLREWLTFVPVTALAALIAKEILFEAGKFSFNLHNPTLLATFPTLAIAVWRRNVMLTVVSGLVIYYGLSKVV